jgi:hypothetical protein
MRLNELMCDVPSFRGSAWGVIEEDLLSSCVSKRFLWSYTTLLHRPLTPRQTRRYCTGALGGAAVLRT